MNFAKLLLRVAKWKAYRGGWLLDHIRKHEPLDFTNLDKDKPIDVLVAMVDHFEPTRRQGDNAAGISVRDWCANYARIVDGHADSNGVCPQHTWFHRFEYLNPKCLEQLGMATFKRLGEVEFHLHHAHDNHESFSEKLKAGLKLANQFGAMLTAERSPKQRFAYIAGNWALDNGCRDDGKSGCNTELSALRDVGCYADFTFPACGSAAQPRKTNAIYYATDCPQPKSYNTGTNVRVGGPATGDLMIVQGPSLIDWKRGYIETGAIEHFAEPNPSRLDNWLRANIHVDKRPDWVFVKLHTHGIQSHDAWFGDRFQQMFSEMERQWNRRPLRLHYVTAREMYNIIKAAEAGHDGDPHQYRNFDVPRPINRVVHCDRPARFSRCDDKQIKVHFIDNEQKTIRFATGPVNSISGNLQQIQLDFDKGELFALKVLGNGETEIDSEPNIRIQQEIISAT